MYNIFDRILSESLSGSQGKEGYQSGFGSSVANAVQKVRASSPKAKSGSQKSDVSQVYKDRMVNQAARDEGPYAAAFSSGGVGGDLPAGMNQDDAMNYHIMHQAYLQAKDQQKAEDSKQADIDWKNHMDQKYGMQGSMPGEGN